MAKPRQRARRRDRVLGAASAGGGSPAGSQDSESAAAVGHERQQRDLEHHLRQHAPPMPPRGRGRTGRRGDLDAGNSRPILLLLNKLSPTHIERQVATFLSEYACTGKGLADVVPTMVDRAADDARYARLHADLCVRLVSADVDRMDIPASDVSQRIFAKCFGIAGQGPCMEAFTSPAARNPQAPNDDEDANLVKGDWFERLARKKYIGHFRFVGELCNVDLFDRAAIARFVEQLMQSAGLDVLSLAVDAPVVDEGRLEALCVLLETCGAKLDSVHSESEDLDARFRSCWERLSTLSEQQINGDFVSCRLSFRMRCILLDLLELRNAGWKSARRNKLVAKTLDQIREEAEREGIFSKSLQKRKQGIRGKTKKKRAGA